MVYDRQNFPGLHGCSPRVDPEPGIWLGAAWAGVVVFDTEILILTVWKTVQMSKIGGGHFVRVLLRDGFTYYGILTMSNTCRILTFLLAEPHLKGVGTTFFTIISVIVISRLMLNLRNPVTFESTGHLDTFPDLATFKAKENTLRATNRTSTARVITSSPVGTNEGTNSGYQGDIEYV